MKWIAMKFLTETNGPFTMEPSDFADPLTFPLAPPACWYFWLLLLLDV